MFELNGINYTLDQLQSAAIENNMDFNSYLQALKEKGLVEKEEKSDADLRPLTVEEMFQLPSYLGGATPTEKLALTGAGITEALSGFFASGDALVYSTDLLARQQAEQRDYSKEERLDLYKQYEQTGLTGVLNKATDYLNEYITREDGTITGQLLKFSETKDIKDVKKAAEKTVDGMIESIPSLVAARFGPWGLATLGVSVAGNKFKEEIYEDAGRNTGLLLANAAGSGVIEAGFEAVTYGLMKRAGFIKNKYGSDTAKRFFNESIAAFGKRLGVAYLTEGASEAATEATLIAFDALTLGDEVKMKEAAQRIGDAFLVGGAIGPSITAAGKVNDIVNPKARERAYNALMSTEDQAALASIAKQADIIGNSVDKSDPISVKKADEQLSKLNAYANRVKGDNVLTLDNMTKEELSEYAELIDRQTELKKEYRKTKNEQARERIKKEFSEIDAELSIIKDKSRLRAGDNYLQNVQDYASDIGAEVEVFNEENGGIEAAQKRYEELTGKKDDIRDADGYYDPVSGKMIINELVAKEKGAVAVSNHEFLHRIIGDTYSKLTTEEKINLNKGFFKILNKDQKDAVLARFKENNIEGDAIFESEEMFTYFSDAIDKKEIKFNESVFNRIGNIQEELLRLTGKRAEFENGRQVYNFLKNYSKTMKKGGRSRRITEFAKVDAPTGRLESVRKSVSKDIDTELVKDTKFEDKMQQLYQDPATWLDIEEAYKPRIKRILRANYSWIEDLDNQNNTNKLDAVIEEAVGPNRGILEMITKYDPESGVPLSGYIGSIMKKRGMMEYVQREFPEGVIQQNLGAREDVQKQVAKVEAEQDVEADIETEDLSIIGQAKTQAEKTERQSKFRRKLGFDTGGDNYNKILEATKKSLVLAYRKTQNIKDPAKRAIAIRSLIREEYFTKGLTSDIFKPLKNFLGTKDYVKNLKEHREAIVEAISTADFVQIERKVNDSDRIFTTFDRKLTSKKDVEDAVNRDLIPVDALNKIDKGQAVNLYKKRMPTEAEFIEFADQPAINPVTGARSGLKGTRKDGFAKAMANTLVLDATMEARQSQEVLDRLDDKTVSQIDIDQLAAAIGREVDVRFSYSEGKYEGVKKLTAFEADNKTLPAILRAQDAIRVRISNDENFEEDSKVLELLETLEQDIVDGVPMIDAYNNLVSKLPESVDSYMLDFNSLNSFTKYIKDTTLPLIREQGFKASVNFLESELQGKNNEQAKVIIDEFIKNIGRSARTAGVEGITRNRQLKEEVVDQLLDGKFKDLYTLVPVESGEAFKDVELHENISNIKNNIRTNKELRNKVNRQAQEARDFIFKVLDSNIKLSEKLAMIDLMSVDQRGAVRKMYTMGASVTDKSNLPASKLTLEHEITAKDMISYLKAYAKNENKAKAKKVLNEILDQARVHVLPKKIDNILKSEGHKSTGGRGRYAVGTKARAELQKMRDTGIIDFVPIELTEVKDLSTLSKAVRFSRTVNKPTKGITVLDFDDTLATSKSLVKYTRPDGTKGTLTPEQYAATYEDLADLGYEFDFSEFSKVVDGKPAPLLNKAKKLAGKFGTKDMFVLTARPADSAPAIKEFLKQNGLDIPLENITGLGNSTSEAKALWVADKVADGYNDFYFADDALKNVQAVQNMLDQFDVKSKVQQARIKFSKTMSDDFNKMLERTKGVPFDEAFSRAKALKLGKNKGKFQVFVPPSADDFEGLLYYFVGKGEQGNKDLEFFKEALIDPFSRAYTELDQSRQTIINDWVNLRKEFPEVADSLGDMIPGMTFTYDNAIRVYLWDQAGIEIPGLSETEQAELVRVVARDSDLMAFANGLSILTNVEQGYVKPSEYWTAGSTASDVNEVSEKIRRAEFLTEWVENKNEIFSEANLNKVEATYGSRFRSALEDVLYRMETGRTRSEGSTDAISNKWMRWLNNSVGAIMFLNVKSALLQTISTVNYVNYTDNNPLQAARAFANQKQYWSDFTMIFNSDFLKQRRKGLKTDIQTAEIASAVAGAANKAQAAISYLLKKGFLPTQIADSFAISAGGATFYRNRYKSYIKQGLSEAEAKEKAFNDFRNSTEESQQSSRPDRISQQQVSNAGRLLLNFQNYPMQQARIFKKAILGLSRGTGDAKQHLARIAFYGFAQNMIFLSLQNALFAMLFDHEDEEEKQELFDTKIERILNGMVDTMLRGSGIAGGVIATLKNTMLKAVQELEKGPRANEANIILEAVNISPAIGSKVRKINKGFRTYKWNKDAISEMSKLDLRNPLWTTAAPVIEGVTNIPTDRAIRKINNMREAFDDQNSRYQRLAVMLGYSPYELGIDPDKEVKEAKKKGKGKQTSDKKQCSAFTSIGVRCKNTTTNKSGRCYAHN
jgi:hypothetical protein